MHAMDRPLAKMSANESASSAAAAPTLSTRNRYFFFYSTSPAALLRSGMRTMPHFVLRSSTLSIEHIASSRYDQLF